jgi:hypothetical protein
MSTELKFNPEVQCDRCGRFGAYAIDHEHLCAECHELRGSCCPEFGGDDQWQDVKRGEAPDTD